MLIPFHRNMSIADILEVKSLRLPVILSGGLFIAEGKPYTMSDYFVGHEVVSPGSIANECLTTLRFKNRKRRQAISTRLATPKTSKSKKFYHSVSIKGA